MVYQVADFVGDFPRHLNLPLYSFFFHFEKWDRSLCITPQSTTASPLLKGSREGGRIPTKVNSDTVTLFARADAETPAHRINADIST